MKKAASSLFGLILAASVVTPRIARAGDAADVFIPSGYPVKNTAQGSSEVKNASALSKQVELGEREKLDFQLRSAEQKTQIRKLQNELIHAVEDLIAPTRYGFESFLYPVHPGKEDTFEKFSRRLKQVEDLVLQGAGNERIFALVSALREQVKLAGKNSAESHDTLPLEKGPYFGPQYTRNLAVMTALYYEAVAQKFETNALSAASIALDQSALSQSKRKISAQQRKKALKEARDFARDCPNQLNRAYRAQLRAIEYAEWSQTRFVPSGAPDWTQSKDEVCPSIVFVGPVAGGSDAVRVYDDVTVRNVVGPNENIASEDAK